MTRNDRFLGKKYQGALKEAVEDCRKLRTYCCNYKTVARSRRSLYNEKVSKQKKLVKKLLTRPKDFTINELKTLLTGFGYQEYRGGKTAGSRVAFIHAKSKHIIRIHKPHPGNELKAYQIALIIEELKKQRTITE